jgi:hypothetical protein
VALFNWAVPGGRNSFHHRWDSRKNGSPIGRGGGGPCQLRPPIRLKVSGSIHAPGAAICMREQPPSVLAAPLTDRGPQGPSLHTQSAVRSVRK